jgi:hypothetical protein
MVTLRLVNVNLVTITVLNVLVKLKNVVLIVRRVNSYKTRNVTTDVKMDTIQTSLPENVNHVTRNVKLVTLEIITNVNLVKKDSYGTNNVLNHVQKEPMLTPKPENVKNVTATVNLVMDQTPETVNVVTNQDTYMTDTVTITVKPNSS